MERKRIAIVGGGAAGMMAAILLARNGIAVTLFEKNERFGKKLLATGNGKCNLGNLEYDLSKYHSETPKLLAHHLEFYQPKDVIAFFESLGLMIKNKNGYLYPFSEQATTVVDILRYEMDCHVEWIEQRRETEIKRIVYDQKKKCFLVSDGRTQEDFANIILCCGGKASPKTGSDGSGYELAKQLGHSCIPVVPSLVQLRCSETWLKSVAGVRTDACVAFQNRQGAWITERGELQLTDYGISGIPVFQISGQINAQLQKQNTVEVFVDFFPDFGRQGFVDKMLQERDRIYKNRTAEEAVTGILNKKIMLVLLKLAEISPNQKWGAIAKEKKRTLFSLCRELKVTVNGSNSFEQAQVCAGGIPLKEVSENLESKIIPGLYFAGEILDVDGKCGGYNLHWAWCSAAIVADAFRKKKEFINTEGKK